MVHIAIEQNTNETMIPVSDTGTATVAVAVAARDVWRDLATTAVAAVCEPRTLTTGVMVAGTRVVTLGAGGSVPSAVFTPLCEDGRPVVPLYRMSANDVGSPLSLHPSFLADWHDWTAGDGAFHLSVMPILYAIAVCVVVAWTALCTVIGVGWGRRPWLQRIALFSSAVYLTVLFGLATHYLQVQYNDPITKGFIGLAGMRDSVNTQATRIAALCLNTLLLLALVQTVIPLFDRQKEKRMALWIGVVLTAATQVVWGLAVFHQVSDNESLSVMPALLYLFQITLWVLLAACVAYYAITKWEFVVKRSPLAFFSVLAVVCSLLNVAFFIVDVGGWWMANWLDSLSWAATVLNIITVWEWIGRVERTQRHIEHDRVLGRRLFEDDYYFPQARPASIAAVSMSSEESMHVRDQVDNRDESHGSDDDGDDDEQANIRANEAGSQFANQPASQPSNEPSRQPDDGNPNQNPSQTENESDRTPNGIASPRKPSDPSWPHDDDENDHHHRRIQYTVGAKTVGEYLRLALRPLLLVTDSLIAAGEIRGGSPLSGVDLISTHSLPSTTQPRPSLERFTYPVRHLSARCPAEPLDEHLPDPGPANADNSLRHTHS